MTNQPDFGRDVATWLEALATPTAPDGLHDAIVDQARRHRQRPAWVAALRGSDFVSDRSARWPAIRLAYVLAVLALVICAVVAAALIGAFRAHPVPSPLGRNGAVAYDVGDLSGRPYYHAHLLPADGTDVVLAQGTCPTFSGNGSVLAYRTGWADTAQVYVAAADGSSPRLLPGIGDGQYALSPDGSQVAWLKGVEEIRSPASHGSVDVRKRHELWVSSTSGGPGRRILAAPTDPAFDIENPIWSPDGASIAYAVMRTITNENGMWSYRTAFDAVDADGSGRRRLTSRVGTDITTAMSWSPDGSSLVFAGAPDGAEVPSVDTNAEPTDYFQSAMDIFVVDADGTDERNLTGTDETEFVPAWSPDGRRVAYVAFLARAQLEYRLNTVRIDDPGGADTSHSEALSAVESFAWSPDGTRLLWVESYGSGTNEQVDSVLRTSDVDFLEAPSTIATPGWPVRCVSWQRLAP